MVSVSKIFDLAVDDVSDVKIIDLTNESNNNSGKIRNNRLTSSTATSRLDDLYRDKTDQIPRFKASDVAGISGYHAYQSPIELFDKYLYQDLELLRILDCENLGIELVPNEVIIEDIVSRLPREYQSQLKSITDSETFSSMAAASKINKIKDLLPLCSSASADDLRILEKDYVSSVRTEYGRNCEEYVLDRYEEFTGFPVTQRNDQAYIMSVYVANRNEESDVINAIKNTTHDLKSSTNNHIYRHGSEGEYEYDVSDLGYMKFDRATERLQLIRMSNARCFELLVYMVFHDLFFQSVGADVISSVRFDNPMMTVGVESDPDIKCDPTAYYDLPGCGRTLNSKEWSQFVSNLTSQNMNKTHSQSNGQINSDNTIISLKRCEAMGEYYHSSFSLCLSESVSKIHYTLQQCDDLFVSALVEDRDDEQSSFDKRKDCLQIMTLNSVASVVFQLVEDVISISLSQLNGSMETSQMLESNVSNVNRFEVNSVNIPSNDTSIHYNGLCTNIGERKTYRDDSSKFVIERRVYELNFNQPLSTISNHNILALLNEKNHRNMCGMKRNGNHVNVNTVLQSDLKTKRNQVNSSITCWFYIIRTAWTQACLCNRKQYEAGSVYINWKSLPRSSFICPHIVAPVLFYVIGKIDGISTQCNGNLTPQMRKLSDSSPLASIQHIVVECKNRVHRLTIPPPIYDQIQAVTYCIMSKCRMADIVQSISQNDMWQPSKMARTSYISQIGLQLKCGVVKHANTYDVHDFNVHRVHLDDLVYQHAQHWHTIILPRLGEFAAAIRRLRCDDSIRYAWLSASEFEKLDMLSGLCSYFDMRKWKNLDNSYSQL